jgi:hypothetical protein
VTTTADRSEELTEQLLTTAERKEGFSLQLTGQGGVFLVKGGRAWAIMSLHDLGRERVALAVDWQRKGFTKRDHAVRV